MKKIYMLGFAFVAVVSADVRSSVTLTNALDKVKRGASALNPVTNIEKLGDTVWNLSTQDATHTNAKFTRGALAFIAACTAAMTVKTFAADIKAVGCFVGNGAVKARTGVVFAGKKAAVSAQVAKKIATEKAIAAYQVIKNRIQSLRKKANA